MMLKRFALLLAVASILVAPAVRADQEDNDKADDTPSWIMDTSGVGRDHNGTVRSNQILEMGTMPANALHLEGENMLRRGDLDGALVDLQKAVEMAPMDIDKRVLYAQALEQKLMKQKPKDPKLYNFLVKQWFFIYKKAEFVDQSLQAKQHIMHLSGTIQKPWERDKTFLTRVMIPEDGSAQVANTKSTAAE